MQTIKEQKSKT